MPKFTISALSWYDNTTGPPWREKLKNQGLHNTTLHLLCTTCMCSCMSYDDVRWFLVRGEAVVGLELLRRRRRKEQRALRSLLWGFGFAATTLKTISTAHFEGSSTPNLLIAPKKLFRWSFLRFFLDKGPNSKHANHGYRLKRKYNVTERLLYEVNCEWLLCYLTIFNREGIFPGICGLNFWVYFRRPIF